MNVSQRKSYTTNSIQVLRRLSLNETGSKKKKSSCISFEWIYLCAKRRNVFIVQLTLKTRTHLRSAHDENYVKRKEYTRGWLTSKQYAAGGVWFWDLQCNSAFICVKRCEYMRICSISVCGKVPANHKLGIVEKI